MMEAGRDRQEWKKTKREEKGRMWKKAGMENTELREGREGGRKEERTE